jgi:SulP family sulfate permease
MALAIASGVSPEHGLYTVIFGGAIVALLGGSRFQVTGPTAAFVVILYPIVQAFGLGGLLVASLLSGLMLVMMGLGGVGRWIRLIPRTVTTGFTAGIATVIGTLQCKDFFGLHPAAMPERFVAKVVVLFQARGTGSWVELGIGVATLSLLLVWPQLNRRIFLPMVPAPLVALGVSTLGVVWLQAHFPNWQISTIANRFSYELAPGVLGRGIPQAAPSFRLPWSLPGPHGVPLQLSLGMLQALLPSVLAITLLSAIESLLSAVVADGMAQTQHDPDAELVALGFGNMVCSFFMGIPATGAIARTATNIRYGAKSPLSAVFHALFTLLIVVLFAPWVGALPMAALAALLLVVAYNMSEIKHFYQILKTAVWSDVVVLLVCYLLTVLFDMVVGVGAGIGLAVILSLLLKGLPKNY